MPILHWLTRDADIGAAGRVPFRLLQEVHELSHGATSDGGDNGLLVQGDNLDALKALLPFYAGKVRCIYIDPPYNTRSAFTHYDDNLEHAKWLGMIVPRLTLLREFLSEDGSIWVSIDDNEGHYLKVVMDEVFGRRNFITTLSWQKRYSRENRTSIGSAHENIILYGRNPEAFKLNRNKLPLGDKQRAVYRNPNSDPKGPWRGVSLSAQGFRKNQMYEIVGPTGKVFVPPAGSCWKVVLGEYEKLAAEGRVYFGKNGDAMPSRKQYLADIEGIVPWTWWPHEEVGHTDEAKREIYELFGSGDDFATPKPERLIQRILHIATNPGDLVLDSFLGSGTTAAVAHKMGRRWIGVEMGDHARTHCAVRLRKVIEGEQGGISPYVGWQGGGGFRFFTLGQPVYDERGVIAPGVGFADLARHVWFAETRTPLEGRPASPLLGVTPGAEGRAVALLFNGILKDRSAQGGNVLTRATLALIRAGLPDGFPGPLTVYAAACRLSAASLKRASVVFRQTPYDLNVGGM